MTTKTWLRQHTHTVNQFSFSFTLTKIEHSSSKQSTLWRSCPLKGVKLIFVSDEANIMMCRNILWCASLAVVLRLQITFLSFRGSKQSSVPWSLCKHHFLLCSDWRIASFFCHLANSVILHCGNLLTGAPSPWFSASSKWVFWFLRLTNSCFTPKYYTLKPVFRIPGYWVTVHMNCRTKPQQILLLPFSISS